MSLAPRNIVIEGPDVFGNMGAITFGEPSGIDAPPFYASFSGEVTINGSYYGTGSFSDIEYVYSSILMETQPLTRIGLRDASLNVTAFDEQYEITRKTDPSAIADIGGAGTSSDGNCVACCAFLMAPSGQFVPLSVPLFASTGFPTFDPDDGTGTRIDHSTDPATEADILVSAVFSGPTFTGTIGEADFRMRFAVRITFFTASGEINSDVFDFTDEIDVSAWSTADFRDIRGTYGATSYDANGIEYVWSVTIA
jgi:hypothetical protein